jgi:hypothetical protein
MHVLYHACRVPSGTSCDIRGDSLTNIAVVTICSWQAFWFNVRIRTKCLVSLHVVNNGSVHVVYIFRLRMTPSLCSVTY